MSGERVRASGAGLRLAQPSSRRLSREYFLIFIVLLGGGLICSGGLEVFFRYRESREEIALAQGEIATKAAQRIAQFILTVEDHMKATTVSSVVAREAIGPGYEFELEKLLFTTPAIVDVLTTDADGKLRAFLSRFRVEPSAQEQDLADTPSFLRARQRITYFSPVEFIEDTEPSIKVAVPIEGIPGNMIGILQAQIDLRQIWEVVRELKFSERGNVYVVSRSGQLIAHSNPGVALERSRASDMTQLDTAFRPNLVSLEPKTTTSSDFDGNKVLRSFVFLPGLEWAVFVEQPISDAYSNLYGSILRTGAVLMIGIGVALVASVFVARRVMRPLAALEAGVERVSAGDLDHRIQVKTGNEIEVLADEFNRMTDALKQSYSSLEARVNERTQELRVANDRLHELDRLKSQFLSNVSHELRTPMTAIRSLVDNMRDGLTGELNEKQQFYLTGIRSSSDRLSRLIRDLLDLSVIQSGKLSLRPTQFSLRTLVHEITEGLRLTANEKKIALRLDQPDGNLFAYADRDKIAQILTNLLGNAIKFTPEEGQIEVSVGRIDAGCAKITIADTGPGIAAGDAEEIFVEFSQVSRPGREKSQGVGLGLAISKKLVEMYGGLIGVVSRPIGSEFYFTVPTCESGNIGTPPNESTL